LPVVLADEFSMEPLAFDQASKQHSPSCWLCPGTRLIRYEGNFYPMTSMTVSFTALPAKKCLSASLPRVVGIHMLTAAAYAEGIYVNKAELRLDADGYHLSPAMTSA